MESVIGVGCRGLSGRSFEATGSDYGACFRTLEPRNFVFELLDAFLLAADDLHQLPHPGSSFRLRDLWQRPCRDQILPTGKLLRPGLLRSYQFPVFSVRPWRNPWD